MEERGARPETETEVREGVPQLTTARTRDQRVCSEREKVRRTELAAQHTVAPPAITTLLLQLLRCKCANYQA